MHFTIYIHECFSIYTISAGKFNIPALSHSIQHSHDQWRCLYVARYGAIEPSMLENMPALQSHPSETSRLTSKPMSHQLTCQGAGGIGDHTLIDACIHAYRRKCKHIYMHTYRPLYAHAHIYFYIYTYTYACIPRYTHLYIHIHTKGHMNT